MHVHIKKETFGSPAGCWKTCYTYLAMHLWDYDRKTIKNTPHTIRWQLERMIQFGTGGKKINKALLRKHFPLLRIDPKKREFLHFLLWHK